MATEKKNERKHELKDVQLFEENGQYYFKLKYLIEDEYSARELEIPKVKIPFTNAFPRVNERLDTRDCTHTLITFPRVSCRLEVSGVSFPLEMATTTESCGCKVFYTEKIIEEKHKEMTLAEIEKKLGYKIKIVAE